MKDKLKTFFKSKAFRLILLVLLCYIIIAAAVTAVLDGRHVRFYMHDEQEISIEYGSEYEEPGVYAVTVGSVFGEGEKRLNVRSEGQVDSSKLGSYKIKYIVTWMFRDYTTERTVNVIDTTPPEIRLKHTEGYSASWFTGYEEEGFEAIDGCDGDISDKVEVSHQEEKIVYTVTDSSGNTASAERYPKYSVTKPEIILKGDNEVFISARFQYKDPGFTAVDSLGNDLSSHVKVEGTVQPYTAGEYIITYSITNELGETVSTARSVTVYPVGSTDSQTPTKKTIYLTFDDGPGPYTDWLLDVLSYYDAEATFFVTCINPDYENCIGRAFREGHAIGVHTAYHNYYDIYASEEAFFNDFNLVQDMIYRQTGSYTSLCRFPGGSSNTVSSFNSGIMSRLAVSLEDMGYKYFDWNVTSGDAGGTTETETVAANIIEGIAGRQYAVVLQHDIKDYSVAAVEQVLIWGRNNGYVFRALDATSPTAHHGIAN